jgi:hypothetical protein
MGIVDLAGVVFCAIAAKENSNIAINNLAFMSLV